jgi:Mn2+/Fe2+ NRAMP family transporter
MKKYIIERLKEKSTITAITSVIIFFLNKYYGYADSEAVATILGIIMGAVLVTTKER